MEKNSKKLFIPKRLHNMNQSYDSIYIPTNEDIQDLTDGFNEMTTKEQEEFLDKMDVFFVQSELELLTLQQTYEEMQIEDAAEGLLLLSKAPVVTK